MQRINAHARQSRNLYPALERIGTYLLGLYCRIRFGGETLFLSEREAFLHHPPRLTQNQIVCFDCNGERERPVRTQLTEQRTCHGCGGSHYLHASSYMQEIAIHRAVSRALNEQEAQR